MPKILFSVLRLFRACGLFSPFLARPAAAMSLRRGQHDAATAEAVSDARARYADPSSNWRSLSESTNFEWKFLTPLVWAPAFPFLRRAPPSVRPYVFGGAILVANMHGFWLINNPDLSEL